ncbi:methyl-accepting chemotaxis protein [Sphingomonas quercus]|uniref:Methyl-accepting transducer domain-containing protein n=1 Tax=Sphingomonas quercus TaxID=2842451 RepID=A0ABS6BHV7_9SPHN|nr:methyl-accepting chemotaxis protein [Sphingomonas quercus]MBU3077893.1 hypothetical protein [Sphingomonas quercus]
MINGAETPFDTDRAAAPGAIDFALRRNATDATVVAERASKAQRMATATGDEVRFLIAVMRKIMPAMEMAERSLLQADPMKQMLENVAATAHLLALNTELQADRAGEGAPVLAALGEEMRALARQAARAGQAVPELVEAVSQDIALGTALITAANEALQGVTEQFQALISQLEVTAQSAGRHATVLRDMS